MQTVKSELRNALKLKRAAVSDKAVKDLAICNSFLSSQVYKNASQILCYSSSGSEIDTMPVITQAFADGKRLAFPKCRDKNGEMDFYFIENPRQLVAGTFGILEPDPAICEIATGFHNAVCVVPGLSFDLKGHRLGYGKGYYDRFLEKFTFITVGLCYNELLSDALPADKYDVPVDYIALQDAFIKV